MEHSEKQLRDYAEKLEHLQGLYVRGCDAEHGSVAYQAKGSQPTVVSNVRQVSPHLFKGLMELPCGLYHESMTGFRFGMRRN